MGVDLHPAAQGTEGAHPPVQLLQQEAYRRRLRQIRGRFRPHGVVHARRDSGAIRHDPHCHPLARLPQQHPLEEGARADLLLQTPLRPLEEQR